MKKKILVVSIVSVFGLGIFSSCEKEQIDVEQASSNNYWHKVSCTLFNGKKGRMCVAYTEVGECVTPTICQEERE